MFLIETSKFQISTLHRNYILNYEKHQKKKVDDIYLPIQCLNHINLILRNWRKLTELPIQEMPASINLQYASSTTESSLRLTTSSSVLDKFKIDCPTWNNVFPSRVDLEQHKTKYHSKWVFFLSFLVCYQCVNIYIFLVFYQQAWFVIFFFSFNLLDNSAISRARKKT